MLKRLKVYSKYSNSTHAREYIRDVCLLRRLASLISYSFSSISVNNALSNMNRHSFIHIWQFKLGSWLWLPIIDYSAN